jgi:hypothetical protein
VSTNLPGATSTNGPQVVVFEVWRQ